MIEVRQLTGHLTVVVTEADIEHGEVGDCIRCPLALALTREYPICGTWSVLDDWVDARSTVCPARRSWPIPEQLEKAIRAFDLTGASFAGEWSLDEQGEV